MRARMPVQLSFGFLAILASCQSEQKSPISDQTAALPVMERVARGANACWFKTNDPGFVGYKMAMELNSYAGKPRVLIVNAKRPESLPSLVVMAEGDPARLQAFGPLMQGPMGPKITAGVNHWARGNSGCPA
jgi:hypothetical protein